MKTQASGCQELRIIPIPLDDEIKSGDSVTDKILDGMKDQNLALIPGDIFVVKHKIVSKAEGEIVELAKIKPSAWQELSRWRIIEGVAIRAVTRCVRALTQLLMNWLARPAWFVASWRARPHASFADSSIVQDAAALVS